MAINETLKFSWGHIVAFLAIIFISYMSFMGLTYLTDGDFLIAGVGVAVIDVLLFACFLGAQALKAAEKKFNKRVIWERIVVVLTPFMLILCSLPMNHFWTVFEQKDEIETQFSSAIEQSKAMFESYESYASKRIDNYERLLAKNSREVSGVSRANKVEALTLQLQSDNYYNLKTSAIEWIDKATGATVWNVFMLANIKTINDAVEEWNHKLSVMSENSMSDEGKIQSFDSNSEVVTAVKSGLSQLNSIYSVRKDTQGYCWLIVLLLYVMLILPYLVQSRNTKSLYTLLGSKEKESLIEIIQQKKVQKELNNSPFTMTEDRKSDSNEYGSFTL